MARSRNIKPGFYKNEDLAECSVWARYIFPGLWMLADRKGRLEDRPKKIKGELLPFDSQEVEPLLVELASKKDAQGVPFIIRYQNSDGRFIQISKFSAHQSPHYTEKPSVIKPPQNPEIGFREWHETPGGLPEDSRNEPTLNGGPKPPDSLIPDSLIPELKDMSGSPPDAAPLEKPKGNGHAHIAEAETVLVYLNRVTSHTYRFRSPAGKLTPNADVIIARLKEGYTGEQLREVVQAKAEQWRGDEKMAQYLRPETLFGKTKFATYFGELASDSAAPKAPA
jgi:uncharacterized phage protein (TIGR02220 family)